MGRLFLSLVVFTAVGCFLVTGCQEDPCTSDQCEGDNGSCMSCDEGSYCTTSPSGTCSNQVNGVYCCVGSGGGGNDDGSCPSGYCYTGVGCCPTTAPWQGGDNCFETTEDCHAAGYGTCYGC